MHAPRPGCIHAPARRLSRKVTSAARCCGRWNYTITAGLAQQTPLADPAQVRASALQTLAHPTFTGITCGQLETLVTELAPLQAALDGQRRQQQRGARHLNSLLSNADRVLITIIYLRQICSQLTLSEMLEIHLASIGQAIGQTRQLLGQKRYVITAATLRFNDLATMKYYLAGDTQTSAPPDLPRILSDPSLTGMSRDDLTALIQQLNVAQQAQVARLRHQRRGRDRLPGTRNSAFRQKITATERILATVLYERGACIRQVLAELFDVNLRTIGVILNEVRPVLKHHGWTPAPGAQRFATAEALLSSVTPRDTPS